MPMANQYPFGCETRIDSLVSSMIRVQSLLVQMWNAVHTGLNVR
nr:MAG TPA: hypothetical protein [Caudoviricetes sp.]